MNMEARDVITISFDQNPAIQDAIKNLKVGDKLEGKGWKTTIKSIDAGSVDLIVEALIPNGFKQVDDADASEEADEPVAMPMGAGVMASAPTPSLGALAVKPE